MPSLTQLTHAPVVTDRLLWVLPGVRKMKLCPLGVTDQRRDKVLGALRLLTRSHGCPEMGCLEEGFSPQVYDFLMTQDKTKQANPTDDLWRVVGTSSLF